MYFSNPPRPDNAPQRTNWKTAFTELLDNPALSMRDRKVIEDMEQGWKSGLKKMTRGRKSYFYIIKERTEAAAIALAARLKGEQTDISKRLEAINERISDRSSWDAGFVESLIRQEAQNGVLSGRQIEVLGDIEGRHTDEILAAREAWCNGGYGEVERERMRVACEYYRRTGYYSSIVGQFFADGDFCPSLEQYDQIVNNKYAQKVIAAHEAAPKYPAGTLVQVRSTAPLRRLGNNPYLRTGVTCLVISTSETIVRAAKGCKAYKVLPVGSSATYFIEERDLKRVR